MSNFLPCLLGGLNCPGIYGGWWAAQSSQPARLICPSLASGRLSRLVTISKPKLSAILCDCSARFDNLREWTLFVNMFSNPFNIFGTVIRYPLRRDHPKRNTSTPWKAEGLERGENPLPTYLKPPELFRCSKWIPRHPACNLRRHLKEYQWSYTLRHDQFWISLHIVLRYAHQGMTT